MLLSQLLVTLAVISLAFAGSTKGPKDDRSLEIMLPMRDGVELHTVVHLPREHIKVKSKVPTVMDRSPYGRYL